MNKTPHQQQTTASHGTQSALAGGMRKEFIIALLFAATASVCGCGGSTASDEEFQVTLLSADYSPAIDDLPNLINVIENGDHEARIAAAHAIKSLGPDAADAIPALTAALAEYPEGNPSTRNVMWNGKRVPYKPSEHAYGHVEYDE